MRRYLAFAVCLATLSLTGCDTKLSKTDLGTVVFEVPTVAGAAEPYQMPQLGTPEDGKDGAHSRHLR